MKRTFFAIIWCLFFFIMPLGIYGGYLGYLQYQEDPNQLGGFEQGYIEGSDRSIKDMDEGTNPAPYIFLLSLLITTAGTVTGKLPGTKKRIKE